MRCAWLCSAALLLHAMACSKAVETSAGSAGTGGNIGVAPSGSPPPGPSASALPSTREGAGSSSSSTQAASAPTGAAGWQAYMDPTPATLGSAERGQYLVDHVLVCGICHTPSVPNGEPDLKNYLAGSRPYDFTDIDGTVITVNAENLTSHDPEGLHSWTDGQIRTAITKGVDDEHYAIYPIMPYPEYALLSPEDVDSIIKYLRTVPANDNVVAADYPRPDIHPPALLVVGSKVPHTTLQATDPEYAAAERGRYLASVACLNCHTEELVLPNGMIDHDEPNLDKAFAGGKQYTFEHLQPKHTSLNITPDATGLKGWTVEDIVQTLKTGLEKGTGRAFCNTHPSEAYKQMSDADMRDIAVYVHSLPPVKNGPFTCKSSRAQPAAASFTQVYQMLFPRITNAHCDMCHGLPPFDQSNGNFSTGTDRDSTYAALVGKTSTSSLCKGKTFVDPKHPESSLLLQKLLPNPPCGLRMPNGGANLSDAQIELVRSWIAAGAADD